MVNVDNALQLEQQQLVSFECSWPEGFNASFTNKSDYVQENKKKVQFGDNIIVYDTQLIYSRMLLNLCNNRVNTVARMNDIGKVTAINQLNKGPNIKLFSESNIDDVISEATMLIDKCYEKEGENMSDVCFEVWKSEVGSKTVRKMPKTALTTTHN